MNEKSYKQTIVELEDKLSQTKYEFDKARDLFDKLRLIQNELRSLPVEAHVHLKSLLKKHSRWGRMMNNQIQREYAEWLNYCLSSIVKRFEKVFQALNALYYETDELRLIENIKESLLQECISARPNTYMMFFHENSYINDVIGQIDEYTKNVIKEIDNVISLKVDKTESCLQSSIQQIIRIEHEKEKLLLKKSISYSSVRINDSDTKGKYTESSHQKKTSTQKDDITPTKSPSDSLGAEAICNPIADSVALGCAAILGLGAILGNPNPNANNDTANCPDDKNSLKSDDDTRPTKVHSAVYAPSEVNRDEFVIVQIYVYQSGDEDKVAKVASEVDEDATRRNYVPLTNIVKKRDKIKILFRSYTKSIEIEESSYERIWTNELFKHEFVVYVPENFSKSNFLCSVNILINDVPVGDMKFKINVVDYKPRRLWAEIKSNGYKKSFISYSHADAEKVRFLAEGFKIQGIDYFFDEHSLRTGDNFPKEIDEYISSCDVFVLCWSQNAKTSDWVRRECNLALQRYEQESDNLKIYPISIIPKADLPNAFQKKFHFGKIE